MAGWCVSHSVLFDLGIGFFSSQNDGLEDNEKNFYESDDEEKEKSDKKKPYAMDPDHRLLIRNTKPLLQSRNAAVCWDWTTLLLCPRSPRAQLGAWVWTSGHVRGAQYCSVLRRALSPLPWLRATLRLVFKLCILKSKSTANALLLLRYVLNRFPVFHTAVAAPSESAWLRRHVCLCQNFGVSAQEHGGAAHRFLPRAAVTQVVHLMSSSFLRVC